MRISDWSSDVFSSDLRAGALPLYCFVYSELLGQLRHDLEEIANQTEVRNLKNRRILILVDGDDGLGVLHAGKMLDRAGYADGDIDFGSNELTRLPHLIVVGDIASVHGRTRAEEQTSELKSINRT